MKKINFISIVLFLILVGNSSFATILEKMDTKKLTARSNLIVIGNVDKIICEYNEELKMIVTIVTIINENSIKGEKLTKVTLLLPGGTIGSKMMLVDGVAEFNVGEKVLLFLEPEIKNYSRVTGWKQGKFTIQDNTLKENNIQLDQFVEEIQSYIH